MRRSTQNLLLVAGMIIFGPIISMVFGRLTKANGNGYLFISGFGFVVVVGFIAIIIREYIRSDDKNKH